MVILPRVASSNLPSGVWGFSFTSNVPLACVAMAVPWTWFGADESACVYAAEPKPRDRQMAVMTPTPARNRFFILIPLCLRWLLWRQRKNRPPPNRNGEPDFLDCRTPSDGTSIGGVSAWTISSRSQRHFQRIETSSAGVFSKTWRPVPDGTAALITKDLFNAPAFGGIFFVFYAVNPLVATIAIEGRFFFRSQCF